MQDKDAALKHYQMLDRQSHYFALVRDGKLSQIDVIASDLSFGDLYASFPGARQMDFYADSDVELAVYYYTADGEVYVRHIVTKEPLVLVGEFADHTIGAAVDILRDMCRQREERIREAVERQLQAQVLEAA
jgi:hypothetical protein